VPVWHASIALLSKKGSPIPVSEWGREQQRKAASKLRNLLAGVGAGEDHWGSLDVSCHLRRRLSDRELARIDPAWMAIPAVDLSGRSFERPMP
jgi:hypothetical protein